MNFSNFRFLISLLLLICTSYYNSYAQFAETIATGRPGKANGTNAVGKHIYQLQSGFDFQNQTTEFENYEYNSELLQTNNQFRFGVKEDFELRFGFGYQFDHQLDTNIESLKRDQSGFTNFSFGFRQSLFEQRNLLPAFAVQFTATSGGTGSFETENLNTELKLIASHRINSQFWINTNVAFQWLTDQSKTNVFYISSLNFRASEKLRIVGEAFGNIEEDNINLLFDLGMGHLLNPDFQLDIFAGYGNNCIGEFGPKQKDLFLSLGFSYRLNKRS